MFNDILSYTERNKFDRSGILSLKTLLSNKNNRTFLSFRNTGKKHIQKKNTANTSINDIHKTESYFSTTPRNNKICKLKYDKDKDFVLLTSLYKLPTVENKKSSSKNDLINTDLIDTKKNSVIEKNLINNNSSNFLSSNSNDEKKTLNKKFIPRSVKKIKNNNYYLEEIMKDKFYEDVEKQMNKKLKDKVFTHDKTISEKLIKMNQVGTFWKGIFDYCYPLFALKKYKNYSKTHDKRNKSYKNQYYNNNDYFNDIENDLMDIRRKPKIYKFEKIIEVRKKNKIS